METTFKLGTLQTLWIKSLRLHPDRQGKGNLGYGKPEKYKACCLGELHLCYYRLAGKALPFFRNLVLDGSHNKFPVHSYEKYGLHSFNGARKDGKPIIIKKKSYFNLAMVNDRKIKWAVIADYIEANADQIFTKSV